MTSDQNRRRGRPKGTTKPEDEAVLRSMATMILHDDTLLPTCAIKQLVPQWTDSILHRLRGKWKARKAELLDMARIQRDAECHQSRPSTSPARYAWLLAAQGLPQSQWAKALNVASAGHAALLLGNNNVWNAARALESHSVLRLVREMESSPTVRMMREIENSPTMRAMRAMNDSPTMRAMQLTQNSPLMRLFKEQDRLRRSMGW